MLRSVRGVGIKGRQPVRASTAQDGRRERVADIALSATRVLIATALVLVVMIPARGHHDVAGEVSATAEGCETFETTASQQFDAGSAGNGIADPAGQMVSCGGELPYGMGESRGSSAIAGEAPPARSGGGEPAQPRSAVVGGAREVRVAELTGGHIPSGEPGKPGMEIVRPNVGRTDVDVIGGDGSYIAVGGPAKAAKPAETGSKLGILKWRADQDGVGAKAYFEEGTPDTILKIAQRQLGAENVVVFQP